MQLRERQTQNEVRPGGDEAAGQDGVATIAAQAQDLLDAGDAAIERGLSQDSGRFLGSIRQSGGQ